MPQRCCTACAPDLRRTAQIDAPEQQKGVSARPPLTAVVLLAVGARGYSLLVDESSVISADLYRYWHVDYQNESIRIVCQDGRVLDDKLEARHRRPESQVATSTFDWEKWWIWSTTTRKDLIVTEDSTPLPRPRSTADRLFTSIRTDGGPLLTFCTTQPA